jgi:hypothetical protein
MTMTDFEDMGFVERVKIGAATVVVEKQMRKGSEAFDEVGTEADTTITFRVNSELKEAFNKVCKTNHSTLSREIKLFMNRVVKHQTTDL